LLHQQNSHTELLPYPLSSGMRGLLGSFRYLVYNLNLGPK
jgi:hypothetical protein